MISFHCRVIVSKMGDYLPRINPDCPVKRTNSSARWINEHVNDYYVKQAKKVGYRSRAAFKLLEINEKDHLLRPGMYVVDLGAAPGGWSQVASQKIGDSGQVFALDVLAMDPLPGVEFVQGDFNEDAVVASLLMRIRQRLPAASAEVDLVMSDISPNISGIAAIDQPRAMQLCEQAWDFAQQVLRPGGNFLLKVFQGQGFDVFLRVLRLHFAKVLIRKPNASRGRSPEVYFVGIDYRL